MLSFPLHSTFLALPLEGKAKAYFQMLQRELEPYKDCLRFQNPDSPHLTLYFWKELMQIEYDAILPAIERIAARTTAFALYINGADTFGKTGSERVLFLTIAFSPELATLKKLCPWPNPPDQPFSPHITLARIDHPQTFTQHRKKIMKICAGASCVMSVDQLRLYAEVNAKKERVIGEWEIKTNIE